MKTPDWIITHICRKQQHKPGYTSVRVKNLCFDPPKFDVWHVPEQSLQYERYSPTDEAVEVNTIMELWEIKAE